MISSLENNKAILTFTDAAVERLHVLLAQAPPGVLGIRIGLKKSGCVGLAYTVDYVTEKRQNDEILSVQGMSVFVNADTVLFLLGTCVDYKATSLSAAFVFENPNQTSECGCKESVAIKPIQLS